ncbi:universal stress protein [Streptomyces spiroverticillatus]|uniref:Universal stress protein n=1 Tax=Streptomyces finlayi TaxID=67296 RepID=A0A918WW16_9ACTN|nr:universal stress protein [Streptomyces finlayi]GHA05197.1 universal stress protein [Streptomyces spiroverticillatus]GHC89119.1 universal stress protein [Streptomyces finlayi]
MLEPVIVGVDGSDASLAALDWAADEAAARGTVLRVLHAWRWERYASLDPAWGVNRSALQVYADNVAATAVERATRRQPEVRVTSTVLAEDPVSALVRLGEESGLVVVGSRGHGELAELLLGSVSLGVAARTVTPVVVVRGATAARGTVVVGVDEPEDAAPLMEFAFHEAQLRGARVAVVHAWRCPAHEVPDYPRAAPDDHRLRAERQVEEVLKAAVRARPEFAGLPVRREVVEGPARSALLDAALTADLLVIGARRRKGHLGMQLGPVNHGVLHHAPCPVAVVPHD